MSEQEGKAMKGPGKWEYVKVMRERYRRASRKEKRLILDELLSNQIVSHRKSAVRLMGKCSVVAIKRRGPQRIYNDFIGRHLRRLWVQTGQMCSKRLKAALPHWLPYYDCPEVTKVALGQMSPATMDRLLHPIRAVWRRRKNTGTKPGYPMIKTMIPIKPFDFNIPSEGFVECDTVAHCGGSMEGVFAWSLTVTDVQSGWTECRAMWGKSGKGVIESFEDIEPRLPFNVKMRFVDNGNEFLNHQLLYWLRSRGLEPKEHMKRGRPYRKNDQCHVEQKNFTHVRELFGYDRIEVKQVIELMNDLYRTEWSDLQNYFCPQMKLLRKTRIGAKYKREHTKPETPYSRLVASPSISDDEKQKLLERYKTLNPFRLQSQVQKKLKAIQLLLECAEINMPESA